MTRSGNVALVVASLAAAVAPAVAVAVAQAAQGTDSATRGDYVQYSADPGELNRFVADDSDVGLHLNDSGAVIRWTSGSECMAAVHDVDCVDQAGGFLMKVSLGDGADTFANRSKWMADIHLGPGDDRAIGGGLGYLLDGGPGADALHGGPVNRASSGFIGQAVTYLGSERAVTVTADNKANDG